MDNRREEAGHLAVANMCLLLAAGAWFIAVERPRVEGLTSLVKELQNSQRELVRKTNVDKMVVESPSRSCPITQWTAQAQAMVVEYYREMEEKLSQMKVLIEDTQRRQAVDRKDLSSENVANSAGLQSLQSRLDDMELAIKKLRMEMDSSKRLEKAAALLSQGREYRLEYEDPPDPQNQTPEPVPTQPSAQAATGGLVELTGDDFSRLLREGDSWVVMFYVPWCVHCQNANPEFQQAGLQAPVHFARIDASQYSELLDRENVVSFPTIRSYSNGKLVQEYAGERTVVGFLGFSRSLSSLKAK